MLVLGKSGDALQYQYCDAIAPPVATTSGSHTPTVDFSTATVFPFTLGNNTTFAFANPQIGQTIRLVITQNGTGSMTGTFPAAALFIGGSKTLTTTASAVDTVDIQCITPTLFLCSLSKAYA